MLLTIIRGIIEHTSVLRFANKTYQKISKLDIAILYSNLEKIT